MRNVEKVCLIFLQAAPSDTGRKVVNRTKSVVCAFVGLAGTLVLIGCAIKTSGQASQDKFSYFSIVVNSDPPGAKVYGGGGVPGRFIGNTPLEIKYTYQLGLGEELSTGLRGDPYYGITPANETLLTPWRQDIFGNTTIRASFNCFVIMDGYFPYQINEQLDNGRVASFKTFAGGHREFTAYLQPKQPVVFAPAQSTPQPSKDGKVVVSCNVEGADIFVDGEFVGNCPSTLALSEGAHTIEVKKEGRGTFKREIRVLVGSEVSMRAQLSQ
jgi:hypothetical protein